MDETYKYANTNNNVLRQNVEILITEYENEIEKKNSLENRTNFILVILMIMGTFIFNNVKIIDIINMINENLNFLLFSKIVISFIIYLNVICTFFLVFQNLNISEYLAYDIESILNKNDISESQVYLSEEESLVDTIINYQKIITAYRKENMNKAKSLSKIIKLSGLGMVLLTIYISI